MPRVNRLRLVLLLLFVPCGPIQAAELTLPTITSMSGPGLMCITNCVTGSLADIPQFDPSLGVLNRIFFEARALQDVDVSFLTTDPTVLDPLLYSVDGEVEISALGLSQTQNVDNQIWKNIPHCHCDLNYSLNYDLVANFLDPDFVGTGSISLLLLSSLLGPVQFWNSDHTLGAVENFTATSWAIDVTYDYSPVPEPSATWIIIPALGAMLFTKRAALRMGKGRNADS